MLASIGVPLAIKKVLGKGLQVRPPSSRRSFRPPLPAGGSNGGPHLTSVLGMKTVRFEDTPLSNIDLRKWCDLLRIPIKGVISRNEPKPLCHSTCIINLDDFGSLGHTGCAVGGALGAHANISTPSDCHRL